MPLIVKGPRQVGITESILHFAYNNYDNVIYINFVEEPKFIGICNDGYNVNDIIKNITRIDTTKKFNIENTIIIFDEIQEYPTIATSLKFFNIDARYDVICSGSLLGISYQKIESNSVGYKMDYEMYSMDFEEFLWAKGYDDSEIENILNHMITLKPFSEIELKVYDSLFLDYCLLGGMPNIVKTYLENLNFQDIYEMQLQLILDYKEDIRKYAIGLDQTRILNVFNQIPIQLAKENKKFQITKVAKGARFSDYVGCIEWLNEAGLINICYGLYFPELPLGGNFDITKYKIYFKDSGLLVAMLDEESNKDLRENKNLNVYKGALYENIVGEALVKSGYKLYYYKRDNATLKEEFFVRTTNNLIPIEVKSKNGLSKSLKILIDEAKYNDIKYGIKLIKGNIGYHDNIYTFPYFCTFLIKRYLEKQNN